MNKFFSANKSKIVWIVIGAIAILLAIKAYQYATQPVFDFEPPFAVLQIQGIEQKGYACAYYSTDNFLFIADTSNKPLVAISPFSSTLRFTADAPPQAVRIQAIDVAILDKPTEELYGGESHFRWNKGCFANNTRIFFANGATLMQELDLNNEQTFTLELERGLYLINVSAKWANVGEVIYAFLIEVK